MATSSSSSSAALSIGSDSMRADVPVSTLNPHGASIARLLELRLRARAARGHGALDPQRDGLALLEREHDAVSQVMRVLVDKAENYLSSKDEALAKEINQLTDGMIQLISGHASLEERFVYPLFASHLKGEVEGVSAQSIYERNVADDDMNKVALDLLGKMSIEKDGQLMLATLKKFQLIEDEHLTQEEHWFSLLRRNLSADQLQQLADTLRSRHDLLAPTRPHSLVGPSHAAGARATHALTGLVDHAVDRLMGRVDLLESTAEGARCVKGAGFGDGQPVGPSDLQATKRGTINLHDKSGIESVPREEQHKEDSKRAAEPKQAPIF